MPPPTIRRSHSTTSVSGLSMWLLRLPGDRRQLVHAQVHRLPGETGLLRLVDGGRRQVVVGLDRSPRRRTNGELEALHLTVPELDGPHDRIRPAKRGEARAERHHVAVPAHRDRALRTGLHARVALPAEIRLLVPGFSERLVERHEVVRTDVLAGRTVQRLAPVALLGVHVGRHRDGSPLTVRSLDRTRPCSPDQAPPVANLWSFTSTLSSSVA